MEFYAYIPVVYTLIGDMCRQVGLEKVKQCNLTSCCKMLYGLYLEIRWIQVHWKGVPNVSISHQASDIVDTLLQMPSFNHTIVSM